MTLEEMRDAVRVRLGVAPTDAFYTTAVLNDLLNEAMHAYSIEGLWPWLQGTTTLTTVANQQDYALAAGVGDTYMETRSLIRINSNALRMRPLTEIREIGDVTGEPDSYCISGEVIILSPTPNSVYIYDHDYYKHELPLVSDTDQPLLPRQYHYTLIHFAAMMAHMRQNRLDLAESERRMWDQWLNRMRDKLRRSTSPAKVRVRAGRMF